MTADGREDLQEQIHDLQLRLAYLEDALHLSLEGSRPDEARTVVTTGATRATEPVREKPPQTPTAARELILAPVFTDPSPAQALGMTRAAEGDRSLERRIGSQWFNRIGILAVLVGMAWFLKLAIDNHWIGPLGRVVIGLLAGIGFIAWSGRFRRTGFQAFAYSLQALGSGILYLSLWAAYSFYSLLPSGVAFAAMIAVTAFNGFVAWQLDAQLLAVFSLSGGLGTPLLLSNGQNHEVTLFSYLLLLDVAMLLLAALRPWARLLVGAFVGTVIYVAGWALRFYTVDQRGRTAIFIGLFFLLFALPQRLARWQVQEEELVDIWDRLAAFLLPVANATVGFFGFYCLYSGPGYMWAPPWLAVGFAAFYLLLLWLPGRGMLRAGSFRDWALNLTMAVSFLALAVPLQTHSRGLPLGWLVEGAVLLWLAFHLHQALLRVLAVVCLLLGLVALLVMDPHASITPVLNERFATYLVGIAVFAFAAMLARMAISFPEEIDTEISTDLGFSEAVAWPSIAAVSALLVNVLILVAVGWEIHSFWWFVRWHGTTPLLHDYRMYAQFTYSAFFMLFGAVLLGIGFARRSAFVRWQALVLLVVAIGKVFLGDVSALSQGYRILSFLALGGLLLGVSYVYQRDWLHLRAPEDNAV